MNRATERDSELLRKKKALFEMLLRERGIGKAADEKIGRRRSSHNIPLSFTQRRLWFIDQLEPESVAYNLPAGVSLKGELDVKALERALQEIVRRHEVLRTSFRSEDGEPVQVISDDWRITLPVKDLSSLAKDEGVNEAKRLATEEAGRRFDLSCGPLVRCVLLRLAKLDHVLVINMHHIVSDGWSMGILIRELTALYEAYSRDEDSPLPDLEVQYADFAVWQREWLTGQVLEQQLNYWKNQLAELEPLNLPMDHSQPAVMSHRRASVPFTLSSEMANELIVLSRSEGATLFMTLLAAFQSLLSKYCGQNDIAVGTVVANRKRAEIEGLIGFFVNTLVLRTKLSDNPTFRQLLNRVRTTALEAYLHQDVPFEEVVIHLRPQHDLNRMPLFQVMIILQNVPQESLKLPRLNVTSFEIEVEMGKIDLAL
jgi:NRPS condensation-like uncharacterized protein